MSSIIVDIEVWCSCGEGLCRQSTSKDLHGKTPSIIVEPCHKCLMKEHEDGYEKGLEDGREKTERELGVI